MVRTIGDNVIVKSDNPKDHIRMKNGKTLWLDTTFDPQRHAVISGVVVAAGPKTKDLERGDKVYFHFNCYRDDFRININDEDDTLRIPFELIYCKVNGDKIDMMEDTLLAVPVKETEEKINGVIVPHNKGKNKALRAIIKHLPKKYEGELKVEDEVIYDTDSDIPIKIEGKEYFRMKLDWILAKCVNNKNQ